MPDMAKKELTAFIHANRSEHGAHMEAAFNMTSEVTLDDPDNPYPLN